MNFRARQAIVTKYVPATNYQPARIVAKAAAGRIIIIPVPMECGIEEGHARAAEALARKYQWSGIWYIGGTPSGYVFVSADRDTGEGAFEIAKPAR